MQLITAVNFISVKRKISSDIKELSYLKMSALNRTLRETFAGKEVDSISCKKINRHMISTKISLGSVVIVFVTETRKRGG